MTENQVKIIIRSKLLELLAANGLADYKVIEGNAPTKQGREIKAIYYFPISSQKIGWQGRKYQIENDVLVNEENQFYGLTIQMQGFAPPDAETTSLDVTQITRMLISSLSFVQHLAANGIGLQQPTDIRIIYFDNDFEQFEPDPNFDFTVTYNRTITDIVPVITDTTYSIYRL